MDSEATGFVASSDYRVSTIFSGALAGLSVDLTLYPIDTVKTRLQSGLGFKEAGGFRSIYAGLPSVLCGSAPSSAVFFLTYENVKMQLLGWKRIKTENLTATHHLIHVTAASIGELVACTVRVPTEIVKQRAQSFPNSPTRMVFGTILKREGLGGLYRGFGATLLRDFPFSAIEFPLWELLKHRWTVYRRRSLSPWQGALCGSVAGAVAAAVTTPLDVVKTRVMLSQKLYAEKLSFRATFYDVWSTGGFRGLYAGCIPRTLWMAFGGLIFFGAYETFQRLYFWVARPGTTSDASYPRPHREHKVFFFDYLFIDFIYDQFFAPVLKKDNRLKTFDDVLSDAIEMQKEREEFMKKKHSS